MEWGIAVVFVLAYAAIALEHPLAINKTATALLAAGLMWLLHALASADPELVTHQLEGKLAETAAVVFFIVAAMTIVEVVDSHQGFAIITDRINTRSLPRLVWIVGFLAFFLSSILDNMTTAIVLVSMMKKLLGARADRLVFAGLIIIAANAGGAWTPIGDVTTTMLWIGHQITSVNIMEKLFLPSLVSVLVPMAALGFMLRGHKVVTPDRSVDSRVVHIPAFEQRLMLTLGLGALVSVPVVKAITHLPPWLCILLALGLLWLVGELLLRNKSGHEFEHLQFARALKRIDMASAMFFVGILLAIGVLSVNGQLPALAGWLVAHVPGLSLLVLAIGAASAVVDNIPLVAAVQGMFSLDHYPTDSFLWEFLAYCAGTGGSMLIIGSAAGVAAMGIETIDFMWYARRITPLAVLGYLAGALVYIALN